MTREVLGEDKGAMAMFTTQRTVGEATFNLMEHNSGIFLHFSWKASKAMRVVNAPGKLDKSLIKQRTGPEMASRLQSHQEKLPKQGVLN